MLVDVVGEDFICAFHKIRSSTASYVGAHPRPLRRVSDAGGVGCSAVLGRLPQDNRYIQPGNMLMTSPI
jgi:hypothetical protein